MGKSCPVCPTCPPPQCPECPACPTCPSCPPPSPYVDTLPSYAYWKDVPEAVLKYFTAEDSNLRDHTRILVKKPIAGTLYGIFAMEIDKYDDSTPNQATYLHGAYNIVQIVCVNAQKTKTIMIGVYGPSYAGMNLCYGNKVDYAILMAISDAIEGVKFQINNNPYDPLSVIYVALESKFRIEIEDGIANKSAYYIFTITAPDMVASYDAYQKISFPAMRAGEDEHRIGNMMYLKSKNGNCLSYIDMKEPVPLSDFHMRIIGIIDEKMFKDIAKDDVQIGTSWFYEPNTLNIPVNASVEKFSSTNYNNRCSLLMVAVIAIVVSIFTVLIFEWCRGKICNKSKPLTDSSSTENVD